MVLTLVLAVAVQAPAAAQIDAARLDLSAPAVVLRIDKDDLEGEPSRLCWSPDGRTLYLRAVVRDRWANERATHYAVDLAEGVLQPIAREPDWAVRCWLSKSGLAAPGDPVFRINVETRVEMMTATRPDSAGAIGQTSDPTGPGSLIGPQGTAIASIARQAQNVVTTTFRLKDETLAEFVNTPATPGLTFGWAPEGTGLIAFSDRKDRLVVMDSSGRKQRVTGTEDVRLPVWSDDGRRLAWIERRKKVYEINVLQIRGSS
jgi:hypothetical protein